MYCAEQDEKAPLSYELLTKLYEVRGKGGRQEKLMA